MRFFSYRLLFVVLVSLFILSSFSSSQSVCPSGGSMVLTDYFNFNEDKSSHGYVQSGTVLTQSAYDCDGRGTLRIGSCGSGSGVVSVNLNVNVGTPLVQLVFASPWQAGGVSAFTLDGVQYSRSCSPLSCSCNQSVSVPAGSTADGALRLVVSDITAGSCNSD
jgi:hypothetical protein